MFSYSADGSVGIIIVLLLYYYCSNYRGVQVPRSCMTTASSLSSGPACTAIRYSVYILNIGGLKMRGQ